MSGNSQPTGVSPLYATTTTIKFPNSDGHGTGFYYNHGDRTYLITNQHVLRDIDENGDVVHNPESVRIFVRNFPDITQLSYIDIDLSDGMGSDWYRHPSDTDVDVAVVPTDWNLTALYGGDPQTGSLAFSREHFISDPGRISGGDTARIACYPGIFVGTNMGLPVLRNALIASPYGVNFDGSRLFVTDARMHPGTSGSPVLASPESMMQSQNRITVGGPRTALLGVHSATFKQEAVDPGEEWLDLNVAWYAEVIPEIIDSI
ncbi:S1 family peptidase [Halococcus salsus]|uniref:S1 family peptidase n=1 Tax=Halococcus salsus TaxID=2162894 RepID=UPI00135C86A5|nr:serine protease [Halococcus salsus]